MTAISGLSPGIKSGFAVAIGVLVALFVFGLVSKLIK
jgi:hypothetical protein